MILALRLLNKIDANDVYLAGFDGFSEDYNASYADPSLPNINPENIWIKLNEEIKTMFGELYESVKSRMHITFLTESFYKD